MDRRRELGELLENVHFQRVHQARSVRAFQKVISDMLVLELLENVLNNDDLSHFRRLLHLAEENSLARLAFRLLRCHSRNHLDLLEEFLRNAQLIHDLLVLLHGSLLLTAQLSTRFLFLNIAIQFVLK